MYNLLACSAGGSFEAQAELGATFADKLKAYAKTEEVPTNLEAPDLKHPP
jgi:hypothetical protein